eukprot:TRINITY_DN2512_c1_g3_i1.p1 TRINITY_DN2512_c1_g3~~TRINITY_DN2512_c1_g3_i1.p1  ORF type:complete len:258 (+),score=68.46 TRINITY_DN2512_c1_g3_i1:111-776(+)
MNPLRGMVAGLAREDSDIESLLQGFMAMGTTDHGTLVEQFRTIIPSCEVQVAQFFLDANNWSLQEAIISFFDNQGSDIAAQLKVLNRPKPQMAFIMKEEKEVPLQPRGTFQRFWKFKNTGEAPWPKGSKLIHTDGETFGAHRVVEVPSLPPGQIVDFKMQFTAPDRQGDYYGTWQLQTESGGVVQMFGDPLWVMISVRGNPQSNSNQFNGGGGGGGMDMDG